ncbi:hypothetical protein Taro_050740 [Colocasia esculenta]|uniref:Uncharacterized protein n=1 Tax=Colocasia esculenta TaxID=4460 RepID=A0A843XER9_COLES|nr:hypothetical protein [Colocasia esculenta]
MSLRLDPMVLLWQCNAMQWEDWLLGRREEEDEALHVSGWWPGEAGSDGTGLLLHVPAVGLISSLCRKLRQLQRRRNLSAMAQGDESNGSGEGDAAGNASQEMEPDMQELIMYVLRNPSGGSRSTLQTFLTVAKSFYYVATCPPATLEQHIAMVLFEKTV